MANCENSKPMKLTFIRVRRYPHPNIRQIGLQPGAILDVKNIEKDGQTIRYEIVSPTGDSVWISSEFVEPVRFHELSPEEQNLWVSAKIGRLSDLKGQERERMLKRFLSVLGMLPSGLSRSS